MSAHPAYPRPVPPKVIQELAREWDRIAGMRSAQILTGVDLSYDNVLVPTVVSLAGDTLRGRVLDVGCGTGHLAARLTRDAATVVGVDPSHASIEVARQRSQGLPREPRFHAMTIEDYARDTAEQFDVAIANMTLMNVPNLSTAVDAIASILGSNGLLVWTVTHPFFWPLYWSYFDAPWFSYDDEIFIEAEFAISLERTGVMTTHIHRPLSAYSDAFYRVGLPIVRCVEPFPPERVRDLYEREWKYPRFLGGSCTKA